MSTRNFRILVVLSVLLPLAASGIDLLWSDGVPEILRQAQQAMELEAQESAVLLQAAVALALLVVVLAAAWGMFLLRRWGRLLALASCALAFVAWPFFGYGVYSGWALAFMELGSTAWGAAIALAFFSAVAGEFK